MQPTVTLPHTDLRVSPICLGTADMGGKMAKADAIRLLDAFLDAGGNFIDTAKVYSDWIPGERSRSEKLIGEWLTERGNRSKFVLATKGAHPDLMAMQTARLSPSDIVGDLDASLSHLRTDYLDLYWLHRDDPNTPIETIIDTLNAQVKTGKIRYFGCSNWHTLRIQAAQGYAKQSGQMGFSGNQMLWNVGLIDPLGMPDKTLAIMNAEMRAFHQANGIAAIPYSSQANGRFSKIERGPERYADKLKRIGPRRMLLQIAQRLRDAMRANRQPEMYPAVANQKRFRALKEIALECNVPISHVVVAYLTSQSIITVPIVGPQTLVQLKDCVAATALCLTSTQLAQIDISGRMK